MFIKVGRQATFYVAYFLVHVFLTPSTVEIAFYNLSVMQAVSETVSVEMPLRLVL